MGRLAPGHLARGPRLDARAAVSHARTSNPHPRHFLTQSSSVVVLSPSPETVTEMLVGVFSVTTGISVS
jgi:hypothetical protein